jgi:hypothetical protein
VKAPRPSAVIGLRDVQTGDARATRVRQLATPSWLSTRPKPVIERRGTRSRCSRDRCENSVINLELATAAGSSRFFSLALRAGAAMTRDDFAASDSAKTARAPLLWTAMKEDLPGDRLGLVIAERARGGPPSCCTLDWI